MTKYEMLYILTAESTDEVKEGIIAKFEQLVKDNGGEVESIDKWGVKKLAYEINFKSEGYYVLMTFNAPAELPAELERQMRISDDVMRFIVVRK